MSFPTVNYDDLINSLHDGLYFTDLNRQITFWNKSAERISGFSAAEVVGHSCADNILVHVNGEGVNLCKSLCPLAACMKDGISREAEVYLHHKRGHRVPVLVRVTPLRDAEGRVVGGAELFTDMSAAAAVQGRMQELERLAMLDGLTQLPNRRYVELEIASCLTQLRDREVPFGLFILDIDHFKDFNDRYGHDVGDQVLKTIANTLLASTRFFDIFGRWGGEEFVGLVRNVTQETLGPILDRIRAMVAQSFVLHQGGKLAITASIGGSISRLGDDQVALVKRADEALYASKSAGRNRCMIT